MANTEIVSIPLIQGKVFRHKITLNKKVFQGFNPFDTGQGLSTISSGCIITPFQVSIPLIQGKVFRPICTNELADYLKFQSL